MSELIESKKETRFRWQLLATASAISLLGYTAQAADLNDEPQVWIELGAQLTRLDIGQEPYSPEVMNDRPAMFAPSSKYEKLPHQSFDQTGKLVFEPSGSHWSFSAAVRYGRSARHVDQHQATYPQTFAIQTTLPGGFVFADTRPPKSSKFANTLMDANESHLLLDFQAGKDVGLGLFGGTSQINVGVRFAQFNNKSNIALHSDPDWQRFYKYVTYTFFNLNHFKMWNGESYNSHNGRLEAQRNFRGVGPSLSWNGSSPFTGSREDGELTFDYGANAAVLFGRQRVKVSHETSSYSRAPGLFYVPHVLKSHTAPAASVRSRHLVVPNVGGFAGVTYRLHDFKISAGYRADFFFNAMDGGNDARKSENIGNYGPFMSVSIGLGG
jgi:hypothetical protein